jgi:signal transduction histidine kinase
MRRALGRLGAGTQHPFWPVTQLSGLLAAVAAPWLLVWYLQTRLWPHLALSGLALLVFGAHAVAWWLARAAGPGAYSRSLWLIASAQALSALVAPLFMADYWVIGLFLLAAVPLEVGAADELRRIPLMVVYALLAAAGMVAIDLLAGPDRVALLATAPGGIVLAVVLFAVHLAGMAWLLWRLRLRGGAPFFTRLDLATQQTLVFTGVSAAFIILVTAVLIVQIRNIQVEQVGRNFQTLAEINAERAGNELEDQLEALTSLGRQQALLQEGLESANASYPEGAAEAYHVLTRRELTWRSAPDTSGFVLRYRNSPQTIELSRFRGGDLLHNNVFLTDRYGGLVAAQGQRPSHFYYGETEWWQTAWNNSLGGIHLGNLTIDPETKRASVFMAVGVLNPQTNEIIGVLASTYDLTAIQNSINRAARQGAAEVILLTADGRLMAGPEIDEVGLPAWPRPEAAGLPATATGASGWVMGADREQQPAVLAYAPLVTTHGVNEALIQSLGWQVVVSDTQANALAGVTQSTKVATLVGVLAMALGVLAATGMARVITRPIEALTTTAAAITAGSLDRRAEPVGPVELVTLAEGFNTLTGRLRTLISSLQDQVRQRTAQLESRAEQLATLNRITQAVTSVRDLRAGLDIVAREMVRLFDVDSTGIALLNEGRSELTVVAEYYRDNRRPPTLGVVIPVKGNRSSEQVIETRRPLFVGRAQQSPLTAPIHSLLQGRETEGLMIVPLLARGEVIGTIGVSTRDPNRELTTAELGLAETIAGHIAGAIDNMRLIEETERARAAAEAANEAKSQFLANVSHELRTPLTSVLGFARIIQKRLEERLLPALQLEPDDRRTQRAVDQVTNNVRIIIAEGERLTSLINDVLDLAKIEAGRVEWQKVPLDPVEVVDRALAATEALFEQKGLALHREVPPNLPQIVGDRDRLIQVLINLLSNAVKFTERGSVTCRAEQAGGTVVIRVIDTGVGIAAADRPKLFGKFMQVSSTQAGKPSGTGLGLPISQQIIEHHGGRLWVESELGKGSTFAFSLPVASAPNGQELGAGQRDGRRGTAPARARKEANNGMEPGSGQGQEQGHGTYIIVSADVRYLVVVRHFVQEACKVLDVASRAVDDLVQAVDEMAANIVVHGYRGRPGPIEVHVRAEGSDVAVLLRDQAPPFDPTLVPEPDITLPLERRPVGGLGIFLSRKLMDEIHHRALPEGGNEVTLVKRNARAS